jgi:hypothetical protein
VTPAIPRDLATLDALLSTPREETVAALERCPGDILVLGAGGKMGPTLSMMARRAANVADERGGSARRRVMAASRWSSPATRRSLDGHGVDTISADLLDRAAVEQLPDVPNVVFMAGQKFGTSEAPARTWAMNVLVPSYCAERYRDSSIVAFSTGNVYPLAPVASGGSVEDDPLAPLGDYGASCVGRERVFEHAASRWSTKSSIIRLNYAIDLRYGVLTDLAVKIRDGAPIDLAMGWVNVIWQGDANRVALESLGMCAAPPYTVNVTGGEALAVRDLCVRLGDRLGREPLFAGSEAPDALLSNSARMRSEFAPPEVTIDWMLDAVAEWVSADRPLLGKPTHFEERRGIY